MSKSIVRLAFDGSVAKAAPPVSCHSTQRVDRAERQVGAGGHAALGQQPGHLRGREVRVEHEAGALAHEGQVAGGGQLVAAVGGAAVLPDDGAVQRLAGAAVPGHDRLALVGDPDGGDRPSSSAATAGQRGPHGVGDVDGVVLHPPRPGEVLRELAGTTRPHGAGRRRAARLRTPVVPASTAMTKAMDGSR